MTLTLDENSAKYQIRAYKPGTIKINDQLLHQSIIISSDELIDNWEPQTIHELKAQHLTEIAKKKPNILIIGTGDKLQFPALEIYGELMNQGIGVEIMNTHAACRTLTALTAEGRHVIAALIIT